jgi:HSP20 family protein
MDKGILTIKGERRSEATDQTDRFSRIERDYGSFYRRFSLPDSADAEGIQAHGRNGVLEIVIPKRSEAAPRRIQVGRKEQAVGDQASREPVGDRQQRQTLDAPQTQQ